MNQRPGIRMDTLKLLGEQVESTFQHITRQGVSGWEPSRTNGFLCNKMGKMGEKSLPAL